MKQWKLLAGVFLLMIFAQGCACRSSTGAEQLMGLKRALHEIASSAQGRVGAGICLLETGETIMIGEDGRYPMQSVYKMPIAMAVLHEVDSGRLNIDRPVEIGRDQLLPESLYSPIRGKFPDGAKLTVKELIGYAVSESDNIASDILLHLAGGPRRVTSYLRSLGLDEVVVDATEREMDVDNMAQYRSWATPRGAVKLLALHHSGRSLSTQSQKILQDALVRTTTGTHRLKGLLPENTVVAHKTGTSGVADGRAAATNDIGIISLPNGKHLAVAVFVCDSMADLAAREAVIAKISRAAYDYFAESPRR